MPARGSETASCAEARVDHPARVNEVSRAEVADDEAVVDDDGRHGGNPGAEVTDEAAQAGDGDSVNEDLTSSAPARVAGRDGAEIR